jgi:hypothetical protein
MLVRLSTPRAHFFTFAFVRAFGRTSAAPPTKVAKEKPKKTKKLLSELSDAVSAKKGAPLPKWDGGLSELAAKREGQCIPGASDTEHIIGRSSNKVKSGPTGGSNGEYDVGVRSVQILIRTSPGQAYAHSPQDIR